MRNISSSRKGQLVLWPAKTFHLLLSSIFLFGLAYILGRGIFSGSLAGDSGMHVGYAVWLNQYFPNIPHWFPLQGGGVSLLHGYPILPHLLLVAVHRISDLSIVQAFRLVSFLAVPLTSLGIYLFCWVSLNKQTLGLIAGTLFILAPVTWTWMYHWGFFSQQIAIVFLPLALIAFDRAFRLQQINQRKGGRRVWLAALIVLIALGTLNHLIVGAAIASGMGLFVVASTVLAPRGMRRSTLGAGIKIILIGGVTVVSVLAAYMVPFFIYGQIANREGLNNLPPASWHKLPIMEFLGFRSIDPTQVLTRMQFPLGVTILATLGFALILLRIKRRNQSEEFRTIGAWVLVALCATIYTLTPWLVILTQKISPLLVNFFNFRSLLILAMILLPVIAAYGAWSLASELSVLVGRVYGRIRGASHPKGSYRTSGVILASLGAFAIAWVVTVTGPRIFTESPWIPAYGPNGIDTRDIWGVRADDPCLLSNIHGDVAYLCQNNEARASLNISEFAIGCAEAKSAGGVIPSLCSDESPYAGDIQDFIADCAQADSASQESIPCQGRAKSVLSQILPMSWPKIELSSAGGQSDDHVLISELLPDVPGLRIDVSPNLGLLAQDLTVYSNTSQIPPYTNQLSLIHLTWGYQLGEFYVESYGSADTVNELTKWLGINFAILNPDLDSQTNFSPDNWELVAGSENPQVMRFTEPLPLASALTRPVILVIGDQELGVYHGLFRLANEGVAPYDEFVLVEGEGRVDSYTSKDLELFDAVVLQGYDYKNSERAWNTLQDYVSAGGSLYVDTGWQFAVPEWEFEQAPNVLPASQLNWTSYGREKQYSLGHKAITANLDASNISPLIWEQDPWSVSGTGAESLRDWAEPVLSVQGNPLIAGGKYGQGRVVWSGMNFISHLMAYDNAEERQLLHNIFEWLVEDKTGAELSPPVVRRTHPDSIEFATQAVPGDITWLYWRESYYPNWRAKLSGDDTNSEIPVFRAGPGFMLMPIQSGSSVVTLELYWEPAGVEIGAYLVSILGGLLILGLVIDGLLLNGNGLTWLKIAAVTRIPRPFLGDGANTDWADRKRSELHHSGIVAQSPTESDKVGVPLAPINEVSSQAGNGQHSPHSEGRTVGDLLSDEDREQLLASWLEDNEQQDDSWVERVLGKEGASQDN